MQRSPWWLAALVLPALVACGSDEDAQAVAALKSQIVGNNAMRSQTEISDEQASCIAEGAVDGIGVDKLQDYRILDEDLDVEEQIDEVPLEEDDADALAGVFVDCSGAERIFEDGLVSQLAPSTGAARKRVTACVRETVTGRTVREILSQSFQQKEATAYASLGEDLGACGDRA